MDYRLVFQVAMLLVSILTGGCSSAVSQSSPESVRDPLGIDRAVRDYYFPDGDPPPLDESKEDDVVSDEPRASDVRLPVHVGS